MNSALLTFAILVLVQPKDGAVVPTLKEGQKAYFSGIRAERFARLDNPADRAKLFQMGATQRPLELEWMGSTNAVYELTIAAEGGAEDGFVLTNRTNAYVTNLETGRKYRWMVRNESTGETVTSTFATEPDGPRLLRADGVLNFRDLGGWKTSDGRHVRQNMIFRSAGLRTSSKIEGSFFKKRTVPGVCRVTGAGIATLRDDFRIKTDLELRTLQETAELNGSALGRTVRRRCIPFAAYDFIDNPEQGRQAFAKIFALFAKPGSYPVLMHGASGCDRTGTLAFLLNGLLGVSEDDLCRDWEASLFSNPGTGFTSERIRRLLVFLKRQPGATLQERITSYAKGCGVTDADIAAFRKIMLVR